MRLLTCALVLSVCSFALADEPPKLELKDSLKHFDDKLAAIDAKLASAQAEHDKAVDVAKLAAIGELEQIGRTLAGQGRIADANEAWEEVLKLDGDNKDAIAYFKAIGRLDVVRKKLDREAKVKPGEDRRFWVRQDRVWRIRSVGGERWQLNDRIFLETERTKHTISIAHENGDKYRIHRDSIYGRNQSNKWVFHGGGRWVK